MQLAESLSLNEHKYVWFYSQFKSDGKKENYIMLTDGFVVLLLWPSSSSSCHAHALVKTLKAYENIKLRSLLYTNENIIKNMYFTHKILHSGPLKTRHKYKPPPLFAYS